MQVRPRRNTTRTERCQCSALPMSYQSHIRAVAVSPLYVDAILGPSIIGRALHRHRRGRGFESRSEPEFFQVSVLVVLRPHLHYGRTCITTVFLDTRLWRTKHPRKRFQNFRQSYMLSTDRIEIQQSQPA